MSCLTLDPQEREAIERIESVRHRLELDLQSIERTDFGAGPSHSGGPSREAVTVSRLARQASVSPTWGRVLFKLARNARSRRILELGACLGISTAYLQSAVDLNGGGTLVTLEGDPKLCKIARRTLRSVSPDTGEVVEGNFRDVLPSVLEKLDGIDLVFIDGHHDPSAVEGYFRIILPHLLGGAVVIIDDVQPLTGSVRPAWKRLVRDTPVSWSVDLVRMGIIRMPDAQ